MQPLNSFLFQRLREEFGQVGIADQGSGVSGRFTQYGNRLRFHGNCGEYYRISCPFCGDLRGRLWINHRWGVGIPESNPNDKWWWAACCYNEDCLSNHENRQQLRSRIYRSVGREIRNRQRTQILPGHVDDEPLTVLMPDGCIPVNQLDPYHQASQYLRERGFDVDYLARAFGVSYCEGPCGRYRSAVGRIIIPILDSGELVGWQGRSIGENTAGESKYYSAPGSRTSRRLYNIDAARRSSFVIICEGATDVWALGDAAVAIFKKTLSSHQANLITSHWDTAIVLLDGDATVEREEAVQQLRSSMTVVNVQLQVGDDPGSMERNSLFQLIADSAQTSGVDLFTP